MEKLGLFFCNFPWSQTDGSGGAAEEQFWGMIQNPAWWWQELQESQSSLFPVSPSLYPFI